MSKKQMQANKKIVDKIDNMNPSELCDYIGNITELKKKFDLYLKHAQGQLFKYLQTQGNIKPNKENDCMISGSQFDITIKVSPLYETKKLVDMSKQAQSVLLPTIAISWSSIRSNKDITNAPDKSFNIKSYAKKFTVTRKD